MKPINDINLPKPVYDALAKDYYNYIPAKNEYSTSELINPVKYTILKRRHREEIQENISELFYKVYGNLMHQWLENIESKNGLQEERLKINVNKFLISGKPDLFLDGVLYDYKMTSIWTWIYKSRIEGWTQQSNIYAHLLYNYRFKVKELKNILIFRDWSKTKYETKAEYPRQCEILNIKKWDTDKTKDFINQRLQAIVIAEKLKDNEIPECTQEDRWQDNTKYAVMKQDRKSALRVLDTRQEAMEYLNKHKDRAKLNIETRQSKPKRCLDYCAVNKWCNFYQKVKEVENGKK